MPTRTICHFTYSVNEEFACKMVICVNYFLLVVTENLFLSSNSHSIPGEYLEFRMNFNILGIIWIPANRRKRTQKNFINIVNLYNSYAWAMSIEPLDISCFVELYARNAPYAIGKKTMLVDAFSFIVKKCIVFIFISLKSMYLMAAYRNIFHWWREKHVSLFSYGIL